MGTGPVLYTEGEETRGGVGDKWAEMVLLPGPQALMSQLPHLWSTAPPTPSPLCLQRPLPPAPHLHISLSTPTQLLHTSRVYPHPAPPHLPCPLTPDTSTSPLSTPSPTPPHLLFLS